MNIYIYIRSRKTKRDIYQTYILCIPFVKKKGLSNAQFICNLKPKWRIGHFCFYTGGVDTMFLKIPKLKT